MARALAWHARGHRFKRNDIKSDKASALEPLSTSRNKFYFNISGGLAQLARALAWHARGHRFDPDILHSSNNHVANDL